MSRSSALASPKPVITDGVPAHPEILFYEPQADGSMPETWT